MLNDRIIASTLIYGKCSFETALTELNNCGFDRIEMALEPDLCPHCDLLTSTEKTYRKVSQRIMDMGMQVAVVNIGDSMVNHMDMKSIKKRHVAAMQLAKWLNAERVVFCAGIVFDDTDKTKKFAEMMSYYKGIADLTEKEFGIRVLIEAPHKITIAETAQQVQRYWEEMDERIYCSLDVAHSIFGNGDPIALAKKMGKRIENVHLRDAVPGNTFVPYGEGDVPFQEFFDTLRSFGYKNNFTIEFLANNAKEGTQMLKKTKDFFAKVNI